jgi:hypothetical protein
LESREQDIKAIFQNQERLRQNLKALGNTADERSLRERTSIVWPRKRIS